MGLREISDGAWGGSAEQINDKGAGRRVEGVGRRAREKKMEEERRKKRSQREREKIGNVYLMREEREV